MKQTQHSVQGSATMNGSSHMGSSGHGRQGTHHDNHHGYRPVRESIEPSSSHGHRSKSTSHHHSTHHGGRDGTSNPIQTQQESLGAQGRNPPQPRSQSHAKGPSGTSNGARDHQSAQQHSSKQNNQNAQTSGSNSRQNNDSGNANAVGHYILGKALGEGTFGKVKLGTHVLTGEKVAVKVLEKSKIKDKKDVERISREIKILKQLHHPNVVQIYEIIETDKDLYLVMEFASGGELFELIVQNQKLKERTASKHLQELLAGVHYIHQLGICHRDLKPENLLIDFDGQLKIVDFGLSNMYDKGMTLKTACGSPCYAAPEMIAGNRYHGLKSDIWSCGVVLYAMLCGYLPFEDQKTSNLYKKIMNAEYSLPKFLSNDAKDILSKIFVTDPTKRIDIEGLKQHPWYRLHQPENQNYHYHTMPRTVNEKLVMKMEASLGFSTESVQRAVENNKHNHLSATYYLLLKKYAQASFKHNQTNRNSAVPSRVESHKADYQQQQQMANRRSSTKPTTQNSDSKTKPGSSTVDTEPTSAKGAPATSQSQASNKYNKFRSKGMEAERLKAPVQDQLVLKNHRREQSANATAGRHNRNGDWGNVEDERRTESYSRPAPPSDEYEIVISKVKKTGQNEERKDAPRESHHFNQNMRSHFASPSPEIGPNGTRGNRGLSGQHAGKVVSAQSGVQKVHVSEPKAKPMEVNLQNIKQQFEQVSTPSQMQNRSTSIPKQPLPKPATYTQATVSSSQRTSEKTKQVSQKSAERTHSQAQHQVTQHSSQSQHRKAKSNAHEIHKQNSHNPTTSQSYHARDQLSKSHVNPETKFSQTQKIQSISKTTEQQSRQQQNLKASGNPLNQTAKVSDLIDDLNMQSLHKTYFDQIAAKHANSSAQNSAKASGYVPSKQSSAEEAAGIEGNNVGQSDTVVKVNKTSGGASSGIFQSLTSVMPRPIIQDINSQNLLKRLEGGSSDNQLRQNYVNRQTQQTIKRKDENGMKNSTAEHNFTDSNSSRKGGTGHQRSLGQACQANERRTTIQHENHKSQQSRLSQLSQSNSNVNNNGGQPASRTPVTGYQTLDTMGDVSSHELKIPINPDTDRGVSKSIFYGTQRIANLNQEVQRYSNDRISSNKSQHHVQEFSKTQAISSHENGGYNRSSIDGIDGSFKTVSHRTQSGPGSSIVSQTKTSQSTKHSRQQSKSTAGTQGLPSKRHEDQLNNSRVNISQHQRQSNNGYSIPTQNQQTQSISSASGYSTTVKNSQQKFQSLKANSAVKVTQHVGPQSTIDHSTATKQSSATNYAQLLSQTVSQHAPKKSKEPVQKTRSHSVSTTQKNSHIYTPSSHRKGSTANQNTSLLTNQAGNGAAATLTAHYRCSTASSTNKERRSSQPPTNTHANSHNQGNLFANSHSGHTQGHGKQRSASSTNYQSAFLGKSLDGGNRNDGNYAQQQRARQKSTRDHSVNSSLLQQQLSNDRKFHSITQGGGAAHTNTSILSTPLDETIFNQSFSGNMTQYQTSLQANTASYNKRRQQVASINELLNVAETLRQSSNSYSMRPRATNTAPVSKEEISNQSTTQHNNFMGSQSHNNSVLLSQTQKTGQLTKPIVVSLTGHQQPQNSTIQNELKASLLLNQPPPSQSRQSNQSQIALQQQQSLTSAMKQITDGLLARQQQHLNQAAQPQQPTYQSAQMHQSYLSDMFAKQGSSSSNGTSGHLPTNQLFKKNNYYNQSQPVKSQTQQVGLKSNIYSPNNRSGKQGNMNNTIDSAQDQTLSGYQHKTPYSGKQSTLDASQITTPPQSMLYSQQLQQQAAQAQQYPTMSLGKEIKNSQLQQAHFNLLQQHQQTMQQLNNSFQGASTATNNFMPPQQLAVSMHSGHPPHPQHQYSVPQPQKPPSVPAPSTTYQQVMPQQHPQQLNFYPMQGQSHNQSM